MVFCGPVRYISVIGNCSALLIQRRLIFGDVPSRELIGWRVARMIKAYSDTVGAAGES